MYNYLKIKYKSITQKKISYSYNGVDSLINNIFKDKKKGIYVDVGCNHQSDLYKFIISKNYTLANWLHSDFFL